MALVTVLLYLYGKKEYRNIEKSYLKRAFVAQPDLYLSYFKILKYAIEGVNCSRSVCDNIGAHQTQNVKQRIVFALKA